MGRKPPAWGLVAVGAVGVVFVLLIGRWVESSAVRLGLYLLIIVGVGWLAVVRMRTVFAHDQNRPREDDPSTTGRGLPPTE